MHNLVPILLVVGLLMIMGAMAYQLFSAYVTPPDFSGQQKPFEARISAMSPPRPGVTVKMGLFARALEHCGDVRMRTEVSEGFELLAGQTEWNGELYPTDVKSLVFLVKPKGLGRFVIKGHVECRRPDVLLKDTVEYEYNITSEKTTVAWRHL